MKRMQAKRLLPLIHIDIEIMYIVQIFFRYEYTTTMTVGTPPQNFTVAIDIETGNMPFVPSSKCKYFCGGLHNFTSNDSSTYIPMPHSHYSYEWGEVSYDGPVGRDVVRTSGIEIPDQEFMEWTEGTCVSILCLEGIADGVIGLMPPWNKNNDPNGILPNMIAKNLLDSPLFSLKLPLNEHDTGELLLGDTNSDLYTGELVKLPFVNATDDYGSSFADLWSVAVENVTFDSPVPLHYDFASGAVAVVSSTAPYIVLPRELAANLTAAIGAKPVQPGVSMPPFMVPCERRQELPNLTFVMSGHNMTISAFDYTFELMPPCPPYETPICITTFWAIEDFGYPDESAGIVLGSPFLKGFYGVFDFGSREIGCEFRSKVGLEKIILTSEHSGQLIKINRRKQLCNVLWGVLSI